MIRHTARGSFMKKVFVFLFGVLLITSCVWTENLIATAPSSGLFRLRGASVTPFPIGSLATGKMAFSAALGPQTTSTSTSTSKPSRTTKPTKRPPPPPRHRPPRKSKKKHEDEDERRDGVNE